MDLLLSDLSYISCPPPIIKGRWFRSGSRLFLRYSRVIFFRLCPFQCTFCFCAPLQIGRCCFLKALCLYFPGSKKHGNLL